MNQTRTIWIVNPYDSLPCEDIQPVRYSFLASALVRKGHRVIWWSSNFFHLTKCRRLETNITDKSGLEVRLIETPPYRKNVGIPRIINHMAYGMRFRREALKTKHKPDLILASVPPLLAPWVAMELARCWNVVGVLDVQDLWPEAWINMLPPAVRFLAAPFFRPFRMLQQSAALKADAITGVSKTYAKHICSNLTTPFKPAHAFPLGADVNKLCAEPIDLKGLPRKGPDEIWLVRAGVVGRFCDIELLLEASKRLLNLNGRIKIVIVGAGHGIQFLKKEAERLHLKNIICVGFLQNNEFHMIQRISDIGLCVYTKTSPHSLINKAFAYMAAGLPIINSVSGEMAELVSTHRIGLNYQAGSVQGFIDSVEQLVWKPELRGAMGRRAKKLACQSFDKGIIYTEYASFLEKLMDIKKRNSNC